MVEKMINRWTPGIARAVSCDVSGVESPGQRSCSTMDSASVSEAGDVGSIPAGSTISAMWIAPFSGGWRLLWSAGILREKERALNILHGTFHGLT